MLNILKINDVYPGDVILCRSENFGGETADYTKNKYVHAAICIRQSWCAESFGTRVREAEIDSLFESYDHIAVLHQPSCWTFQRVEKLQQFIADAISRKAKFNSTGIRNFEENKKNHEENVMQNLNDFFDQKLESPIAERDSYFCSELVAAAHVAAGIIHPSAATIYDPSTLSPSGLAIDFTFGIFAGYLLPYTDYNIPKGDEFRDTTPCHEIFQTKK